jgi:hypothetical protein
MLQPLKGVKLTMTEFLMTIKGNEAGSGRLAEVLQGTLC